MDTTKRTAQSEGVVGRLFFTSAAGGWQRAPRLTTP